MVIEEPYPEHVKMAAVADRSQAIGEFLDSSRYVLAEWSEFSNEDGYGESLHPVSQPIEKVLSDYFHIDLTKIEQEKRAMLDAVRREAEQ